MESLEKKVESLKEQIKRIEADRDELKVALHIVTVHCCHLIGEKEGKKVEDVYKEIRESVNTLMNGCVY